MKKMNILKTAAAALLSLLAVSLSACSDDDTVGAQTAKTYDMGGFAKGADVSWLTEMEANDIAFYDATGRKNDCMKILRSLGMNAIRLRVWVDPADGWCGQQDVVAKAVRAHNLGMRLMIDFHYSDSWADPSKQNIPEAWKNYTLEEMKQAVANHTRTVLEALKKAGIDSVEWVQVGNETTTGMLWPMGKVSDGNFANFAQLVNAGYDAAKEVYPKTKVIVHVDQGNKLGKFTWLFDGLKAAGGKWDVIGMSLYPDDSDWTTEVADCLANIEKLKQRYGTDIVISEVGMDWNSEQAEPCLRHLVDGAKKVPACEGVFYWEPECYNGWKQYAKGAFDNSGKPTKALDAFK